MHPWNLSFRPLIWFQISPRLASRTCLWLPVPCYVRDDTLLDKTVSNRECFVGKNSAGLRWVEKNNFEWEFSFASEVSSLTTSFPVKPFREVFAHIFGIENPNHQRALHGSSNGANFEKGEASPSSWIAIQALALLAHSQHEGILCTN